MGKSFSIIKNILFIFSKNSVFCVALLWFMFILIIGTLSQKEIGLYSSQQKYFVSNFIWFFDLVPLPGGKLTLIVIFVGLCVKLLSETWKFKKIGVIFIHLSVLVLLLGGVITMYFSEEGFIIINQGEKSNIFIKKNEYNVTISNNGLNLKIFENDKIYKLTDSLNVKINKFYRNSDIRPRKIPFDEKTALGLSRFFKMYSLPVFLEEEENKCSVSFYLISKFEKKLCYLIENEFDVSDVLIDGSNYSLSLNKSYKVLPFFLNLVSFEKKLYNGTDKAKSYISRILIEDKNIKWKYDIEMNKPLRYGGYIFYQTSFIENKLNNTTILTVTKDYGEFFPYVSCLLLFIGFLIHLVKLSSKLFIFKL